MGVQERQLGLPDIVEMEWHHWQPGMVDPVAVTVQEADLKSLMNLDGYQSHQEDVKMKEAASISICMECLCYTNFNQRLQICLIW
jgi:hypothetical protein